ncbi:MAG TPA: dephospho-CoA kinase [Acholeplasmataceae bacterium]|nr:dephospho-CoA kinase [Acholeplasmataceae bacterium]
MSVINAKNKSKIIGLTGGIATGKTTVSNYLKGQGFLVFDSDETVSKLWKSNKSLQQYIKNKYQIDITKNSGKKALAELIFNNDEKKVEIELLIHPFVFKEMDEWIKANHNESILFLDIPLLFEISYQNKVDKTIVVYANLVNQINRLMKRNNLSKTEALSRINAQMNIEDKKLKANYILDNNSTLEVLYKQIDELIKELI